jgi:LacI family transcriptional regulator
MRDVAALAGVGVGTVSRVVNGDPRVSDQKAELVRHAIDTLGFRRNELARALRPTQKATTLALLLGDLTNPFYASIAGAAVTEARRQGYAVVVSSVDEDPEGERRAVSELVSRRVAGLLIVPDQGDHSFLSTELAGQDIPVVFVDRPVQGFAADVVVLDNEHGGYLAAQHLAAQGHRRIAILVAPSYHTTGRRLEGYRRALEQVGRPAADDLVVVLREGSVEEAEAATRHLLARPDPPTAVFTTTNFLSEGALRALRRHRASMALVGFDDFRFADMLPTPVSVVTGDTAELGRLGSRLLLERINGDDSPHRRVVLPVRLVARGSGELAGPR